MRALVVFDSDHGNTRRIAEAISAELGHDFEAASVRNIHPGRLAGVALLIAGSPVEGRLPSTNMRAFLAGLDSGALLGVEAAAFDTRSRLLFRRSAAETISAALE